MNLLRRLLPGIALIAGTFLFSIGLQTLAAWTGPSAPAPGADAYAPLNTGPTAQTKNGNLTVGGQITITGGTPGTGKVLTSSNASGLATWTTPSGITSLSQGTGISFSANPITTTGTISLANTTVTPGSYTNANITVDAQGRLTAASNGSGGGISGSGTTNYLPKFTPSGTALGNSRIYDDGTNAVQITGNTTIFAGSSGGVFLTTPITYGQPAVQGVTSSFAPGTLAINPVGGNVGIGTASPSEKLHVNGNLYVGSNFYKAGNTTSISNALSLWSVEGGVISGFNSGKAVGMGQTTSGYPGFGISSGATTLAAFYHDPFSNETVVEAYGARNVRFATNGTNRMTITSGGNVNIGPQLTIWTDSNAHIDGNGKSIFFQGINASIDSSGNIYGKTKNFRIDDPLDPEHQYLIHTSLEGPEAAVYYRGEGQLKDSRAEITLPAYFEALTRKDGRTVLLTNIDGGDVLWIETQDGMQIKGGKFIVRSSNPDSSQKFNWEAKAVRADIEPLKTEVPK